MKLQVKESVYNELSINKSKFITHLLSISSLEDVKAKINEFKEKYKDATHVCYAYILDENTFKYYDDGEPSSTAGAPIYQTLKNNNLIYTLCVVIRYFGGIKLGVGGLIKAYTNSCLEALNKATLITYEVLTTYQITIDYSNYDKLSYFFKISDITPLNKEFKERIIITVQLNEINHQKLCQEFSNIIQLKNMP